MTAPVLAHKKFWIVKPKESTNQILNPSFDLPDGKADWTASGAGVTIADTTTYTRRGSNAMQVNPATNVASGAYHPGLTVVSGSNYTFSCDVKGVAGQAMRIYIADVSGTVKATKTWTATGYWQRQEVTHTAAESIGTYRAYVIRDAVASTAAYYVDGAQFEQTSKATTFIDGEEPGCRWNGLPRNSSSTRSALTRYGGELIDFDDYCSIASVVGLGNGDWNQIVTKMTSGGDMYQGAIRKSRKFSIVVDFTGATLGAIEAKRKALIDALRPDMLDGQECVIRYQGVDASGIEATQPVDIVCVPLGFLDDTPTIPSWQRAKLDFSVPSGLLDGAYQEASALGLDVSFPAEFIVKRNASGDWATFDTDHYDSLITGLNGYVLCMAEAPNGNIYAGGTFTNAGGDGDADYLARWNGTAWVAVVAGINAQVTCMAFDANGDLYIGGQFFDLGSAAGDYIVKITDLNGTPTVNALGTGANNHLYSISAAPNGGVYIGGDFTSVGGVANTAHIALWNGTAWSALATGLNGNVTSMCFAPNGNLYVGGNFTNADGTYGDYLCYWSGTVFVRVGTVELSSTVESICFDEFGKLYVGGDFTNAGGYANADYIAKWNGTAWESLSTGTNGTVWNITINSNKVYVGGAFTTAGGLTLTDRVVVWSNGSWQPLDIDLPGTAVVRSILPASDGSLYIGGAFSTAAQTPDVNAFCGYKVNVATTSASANTYPSLSIIGPGALKGIANYSTGSNISFDSLTLLAGERLTISLDPTNLSMVSSWSGRGNVLRYVTAGSDYGNFYLKPGANDISIFMSGTTAASGASILWKPRYWGLDGALL